jgi:diguanylate cyclase (GGDEF)-like protein/PAS domain S-box-containing protein
MSDSCFSEPVVVLTDSPRVALLRLMGLIDESPEQEFDEIVELVTSLCDKPLGAMTLLDDARQYTKATVGFPSVEVPLKESICRYTVLQDGVMMVEDTHADARFDEHSAAIHCDGGIRFYAGMPLKTVDGTPVGALCVMDTVPSTMTEQQVRLLELLGRQISARLQLRERAAAVVKMAEERTRASTMFDTILNNLPVEIYLKNSDGRIQFYNDKLAERFKISKTEWLGKSSYDLWDTQTADGIVSVEQHVLETGRQHESFTELASPDGEISYWRSMKVPCLSPDGAQLLACCAVDITEQMQRERTLMDIQDELEEANRKLNSLALTDALTGLLNRRAFDTRLETTIIASQRNKRPMAMLMLDVDNFKSVNDRYGHPYGDEVLQHVSALLKRCKRAEDIACRFGGEEFAVLLPRTGIEGAQRLGRRILSAMHMFPWKHEPVTTSIGVAMCTGNGSPEALVHAADVALYRAKREGKDRMVCNADRVPA